MVGVVGIKMDTHNKIYVITKTVYGCALGPDSFFDETIVVAYTDYKRALEKLDDLNINNKNRHVQYFIDPGIDLIQ